VGTEVEVEIEAELEVEGENKAAHGFLKGTFSEAYCARFNGMTLAKVPVNWPADVPYLGKQIKAGWTLGELEALIPVFLNSEDDWLVRRGYCAAEFIRLLVPLDQARVAGKPYGKTGAASATTRPAPDTEWEAARRAEDAKSKPRKRRDCQYDASLVCDHKAGESCDGCILKPEEA
jgi:hypothetical protein